MLRNALKPRIMPTRKHDRVQDVLSLRKSALEDSYASSCFPLLFFVLFCFY